MTLPVSKWRPGKHPRPCVLCGRRTYRKSMTCKVCDAGFPDPGNAPEHYLQRCAEELLKRHEAREAALVKLGMRREAA